MKLTSKERVILFIFIPIFVLALGFFLLIKPQMATNAGYKADLVTKQAEKDELDQKIADAEGIEDTIKKTYDNCQNLSEFFYPEMDTYQADQLLSPICTSSHLKMKAMTLDYAEGEELYDYQYDILSTIYSLQDTVKINEGELPADGDDQTQAQPNASTQQVATGVADSLAVTNVSIEVYYDNADDVFVFADKIKELNKAVLITGVEGKDSGDDKDTVPTATITLKIFSIGEIDQPQL